MTTLFVDTTTRGKRYDEVHFRHKRPDRLRRPQDDARVIPIPAVDLESVIDIRQNDDSDSITGVERSGGDAGVEASALVNSDSAVGFGQGDEAGVGATVLVNSDRGADAGWSDEVAGIGLMDSISSDNVVDVGQPEGGTGTGEVWAHDDGMGTLGQQRHDMMTKGRYPWVPATWQTTGKWWTSSGRLRVLENRVILESVMDREVTHAIPTTE